MERSEIIKTLQELAPNDHAVLFYSSVSSKRELVFPFLDEALQQQGVAVYVTDSEPLDELKLAMKHWGIHVERHESDRSLTITSGDEFTTAEDRLNDLRTSPVLRHVIDRFMKRGGPVKVAADLMSFVKRGMVDELIKRERALGRRLALPMTLLCCYEDTVADIKEGEFLIESLQTHNHAVFPGIAFPLA